MKTGGDRATSTFKSSRLRWAHRTVAGHRQFSKPRATIAPAIMLAAWFQSCEDVAAVLVVRLNRACSMRRQVNTCGPWRKNADVTRRLVHIHFAAKNLISGRRRPQTADHLLLEARPDSCLEELGVFSWEGTAV